MPTTPNRRERCRFDRIASPRRKLLRVGAVVDRRDVLVLRPSTLGAYWRGDWRETLPKRRRSSREAILAAATREFAEHGRSGTKMERVAQRAGYNKSLVYRHFSNKEALFEECVRQLVAGRAQVLARAPVPAGDALVYFFDKTVDDDLLIRILMQEALVFAQSGAVAAQDERRHYYAKQVAELRRAQREDGFAPEMPAPSLFLALLALIAFPGMFPQIVETATGRRADSPAFRREWRRMLRQLARRLEA